MVQQIVVYFLETSIKLSENILIVGSIQCPACLTDRVHAQHAASYVDCLDPCA